MDLHARLTRAAVELMSRDTPSRGFTRHLPPTPSLPGAKYDAGLFLAQLPE